MDSAGALWRDLPECYGAWESVSGRFYRWQRTGVWYEILQALQRQADAFRLSAQVEARGKLDWQVHPVDGSTDLSSVLTKRRRVRKR